MQKIGLVAVLLLVGTTGAVAHTPCQDKRDSRVEYEACLRSERSTRMKTSIQKNKEALNKQKAEEKKQYTNMVEELEDEYADLKHSFERIDRDLEDRIEYYVDFDGSKATINRLKEQRSVLKQIHSHVKNVYKRKIDVVKIRQKEGERRIEMADLEYQIRKLEEYNRTLR